MRELWRQIELWFGANAPELVRRLRPGAPETAIASAESALGLILPRDLRESILIHDGEAPEEAWLFGSHSLLSLSSALEFWCHQGALNASGAYGEPPGLAITPVQIQPMTWSPGWVPFAYDGSGGYLHVDLAPASRGTPGQVIQTTSDGDLRFVADSFRRFLQVFVYHLHAGAFDLSHGLPEPVSGDNHWWDREL
jgi:cell wall assembly regulator SMI1